MMPNKIDKKKSPLKKLIKLFNTYRVLDFKSIQNNLSGRSKRSIFRDLSTLKYYSSYSHAGKYYTLENIAIFNSYGVWHYSEISFSKHGTLKNTVLYIIEKSDHGMIHKEIEIILHIRVHNVLLELTKEKSIQREPIDGVYHYFGKTFNTSSIQKESIPLPRKKSFPELDEIRNIKILTEVITLNKDIITAQDISLSLKKKAISCEPEYIDSILSRYNISEFPGYEIVRYIYQHINTLTIDIHPKTLFAKIPTIKFRTSVEICSCGGELKVLKTVCSRKVVTLMIGEFNAHETIMVCNDCCMVYRSEQLREIVPQQANFGYDVIAYVGEAIFVHYKDEVTVQNELFHKNIRVSKREVGYLGMKFIIYIALIHKKHNVAIKKFMKSNGGYILHLDGTLEGDSPFLMTTIDEISNIVLDSIKLPSENAVTLIPFLDKIKKAYGEPLGIVHDMGKGILNAVKEVFPDSNDYICHFHFLRDLGKDFFGKENSELRIHIRRCNIRSILRQASKELLLNIKKSKNLEASLETIMRSGLPGEGPIDSSIGIYITIQWILNTQLGLHGLGFPFDRIYLDFYIRISKMYSMLQKISIVKSKKVVKTMNIITTMMEDKPLKNIVASMQKKVKVFDQLRKVMRIALPENKKGLNDKGNSGINIKTIEKRVKIFCTNPEFQKQVKIDITYSKVYKQIQKYWEKLFADPIRTKTSNGVVVIQPQRTNNLMEQFFRDFKRNMRKKSGKKSLTKEMKTLLHDTPLVKNLKNKHYVSIIKSKNASLAECFAKIDSSLVKKEINWTLANFERERR